MKYVSDFVHPKTHERRTIVVELDNDEIAHARRNLGTRWPGSQNLHLLEGEPLRARWV